MIRRGGKMFSEKEKEIMKKAELIFKKLIAEFYRKRGAHHIRLEHITPEFIDEKRWEKRDELIHGFLRKPKVDEIDFEKMRRKPSFLKRLIATFR